MEAYDFDSLVLCLFHNPYTNKFEKKPTFNKVCISLAGSELNQHSSFCLKKSFANNRSKHGFCFGFKCALGNIYIYFIRDYSQSLRFNFKNRTEA